MDDESFTEFIKLFEKIVKNRTPVVGRGSEEGTRYKKRTTFIIYNQDIDNDFTDMCIKNKIPHTVARWALEELYVHINSDPQLTADKFEIPTIFTEPNEWRRLLLSKEEDEFKEIGECLETMLRLYNEEYKKR